MAQPDGQTANSLIAELAEKPYAFDFYAAVRLLQTEFRQLPRIGHSWSPTQDPVRFAQSPSLEFAPATLEAVQRKDSAAAPVLFSRHFGLFGPNGPLPSCLTEYARERILHHGDRTFAAFCNVFHHRMFSFFFRAWADAHKTVDLDRTDHQQWAHFVGSLIGMGMGSLQNRETVPDRAKLYFAGRLAQQTRSAEGLEAVLQDFFGIPTEVHPLAGRWIDLPPDSVCRLGEAAETGALGLNVIMGTRFWTCQLHFHLRMGPMRLKDLERMLPTGKSFRRLCDWIRQYSGEHFSWDLRLVLAKDDVPSVQLGKAGQLGWTTWLKAKPFEWDAEDLVVRSDFGAR